MLPLQLRIATMSMSEDIISLEGVSLVDFLGVNEKNLSFLRILFPKLQLVVRGDRLKIFGDKEEIKRFEEIFGTMRMFFERFGRLTEKDIMQILNGDGKDFSDKALTGDVLVYGRSGKSIRPVTPNQDLLVSEIGKKDMVFAIGPAGSGKTYVAVALAVKALKAKEVKRIIITRPAVEAGENLGFLPGDMKEKLDPYLQPLYDALRDMIPTQKLLAYWEEGIIEIAPLAFMRGRTLDNAFVILDEAQNATENQMKMFLTRMGKNAKFVITGDITQIDLPKNQPSGLKQAIHMLKNIPEIGFVFMEDRDIVRHPLVAHIVKAYREQSNIKYTGSSNI